MQRYIRENTRRVLGVIMFKALWGLIALGVTMWFAWWEYGVKVFENHAFQFIMFFWFIIGIAYFIDQLDKAMKKSPDDKLDEIIKLLRGIRLQNRRNHKKWKMK